MISLDRYCILESVGEKLDIEIIFDLDEGIETLEEANKVIYPIKYKDKNGKDGDITILAGQHVNDRQNERNVKTYEIINAVKKAKSQIYKLVKDEQIRIWTKEVAEKYPYGKPDTFVICDTGRSYKTPLSVVGFVQYLSPEEDKIQVVIKTVALYKDFAALLRPDSKKEKHIFLY